MLAKKINKEGLLALLEQNDQGRQGYNDTLISVSELPAEITWLDEMPTLNYIDHCSCIPTAVDVVGAIKNYFRNYRYEDVGECFMNLLKPIGDGQFIIAGGSISDILRTKDCVHCEYGDTEINDFDVFAVNLTPEVAEDRIMQFIRDVGDRGEERSMTVYRTPGCITVILGMDCAIEIQFITRTYSSIAQVLYGFDIAPAAVALTHRGKKWDIVMTLLAGFAYKTNAFPVDLTRRRASFEMRIRKYLTVKCFDVIFPHLDPAALRERQLNFSKFKLCNIKITKGMTFDANYTTPELEKDALTSIYGAIPYNNNHNVIMFNVFKIMNGYDYLVSTYYDDGVDPTSNWRVFIDSQKRDESESELFAASDDSDEASEKSSHAADADSIAADEPVLVAAIAHTIVVALKFANSIRNLVRLFKDADIVQRIIAVAFNYEINKDFAQYSKSIVEVSREIAEIVTMRSAKIEQKFTWRKCTDWTTLAASVDDAAAADDAADAVASSAAANQFELKYIDPEAYYGQYYLPDETLTKSALKTAFQAVL